MLPYTLFLSTLLLTVWMLAYPSEVRSLIADLKRRWRLHIIQQEGTKALKVLSAELRTYAKQQGIDNYLVDDVIARHRAQVVGRLGTKAANDRLGEPSPLERWY